MAFNKNKIRIKLKLANGNGAFSEQNVSMFADIAGQFSETAKLAGKAAKKAAEELNTVTIEGMRTIVEISSGGGAVIPSARVKIYGLNQDTMDKLIALKWRLVQRLKNEITIDATDENGNYVTVFHGSIFSAIPDYQEAPNVAINIEALTNGYLFKNPTPAISRKGVYRVYDIVKEICEPIEFALEPEDGTSITATIENPYLTGSDLEKIMSVCDQTSVKYYIENKKIILTNKDEVRKNKIAILTPKTGLIGYPIPTDIGIICRCLFDPNVIFGGVIKVEDSLVKMANGYWRVYGLRLTLESELEQGRWFCEISAQQVTDAKTHIATNTQVI